MRSINELIPRLRQATENKKLRWESAPGGYTCAFGDYKIFVYEWSDPDNSSAGVTARLTKSENRFETLDEVVADQFDSEFAEVSKLFLAARRSALNVDDVIAGIEGLLDKL